MDEAEKKRIRREALEEARMICWTIGALPDGTHRGHSDEFITGHNEGAFCCAEIIKFLTERDE